MNDIRYLHHNDIDKQQWDRCITSAGNGLVYALSFYLDKIAAQWDALVLNNYEAVMPLTYNRKYGISYLYQPFFAASLGVFGNKVPDDQLLLFLQSIPDKFRYWDIDLNEANVINNAKQLQYNVTTRANYLLCLHSGYQHIRQGYKRLATRMIKRSADHGIVVYKNVLPGEVIAFYQRQYRHAHAGVPAYAYERLRAAAQSAYAMGKAVAYLAKWPDGEVAAAYLLLIDGRYAYSVIGGSTDTGKTAGAFYLLTDAAIKDVAGTNRLFRFEGSDIAGIAFFNAQFGAEPVHYQHLLLNRLPFPLNLLKK